MAQVQELFVIKETIQKVLVASEGSYELKVVDSGSSDSISGIGSTEISLTSLPKHLVENTVYVVDSVKSGTGRSTAKDLYKQVIKPVFDLLKIKHHYVATTSALSISDLAKSFDSTFSSTVLFISGDTSVNEFVNNLPQNNNLAEISIFPFPLGTGNSLALSLDLTDEISALRRLIVPTSTVSPLNLYEANFPKGSYFLVQDEKTDEITSSLKFLVVTSWAFHASLVADSDTPELRKHGLERFKLAAYSNLSQEQKYEGQFSIDNELVDGPFAYWLLTSSQRFEPTFEILPKGDIFERSLFLVSFNTEDDKDYIMGIMGEVYNKGSHIDNDKVTYKKITADLKHIVLSTKNSKDIRKRRFCLDGSIIALPDANEHEVSFRVSGNNQFNWNLYIIH